MTDDLIDRLSAQLRPVPKYAMRYLLLGALALGAVVAWLTMQMLLGLRGDFPQVLANPVFWIKFGYTLALALFGAVATFVLARPEGHTRWPWLMAGLVAIGLAVGAAVQISGADQQTAHAMMMGSSSLVCPWYIVALSLPTLVAVLLALRQLAPTKPTLAGLAAGLFAGGTGAWIYAFHCGENGLAFLLIWYTLGIAIVSALGAIAGRFALRW